MIFKNELDLEMATQSIIETHFPYWSWQVPNYNRVIDFGRITRDNKLIGIEYKLYDWKTAIWQAVRHRLIFDFLYILIPKRKITKEIKKEAKKTGIGVLIFADSKIKIAIKPKIQWLQWIPKKKSTIRYIKIISIHDRNEDVDKLREKIKQFNQKDGDCHENKRENK